MRMKITMQRELMRKESRKKRRRMRMRCRVMGTQYYLEAISNPCEHRDTMET
jgi:hypothetical protein